MELRHIQRTGGKRGRTAKSGIALCGALLTCGIMGCSAAQAPPATGGYTELKRATKARMGPAEAAEPLEEKMIDKSAAPDAALKAPLPILPPQVLKGDGTGANPYFIRLRHAAPEQGDIMLSQGIFFHETTGPMHFLVIFRGSQLQEGVREAVALELRHILRLCLERMGAQKGMAPGHLLIDSESFLRGATEEFRRRVSGFRPSGLNASGAVSE